MSDTGAYPPYVEAMAHAIGGVLITRGSTYEAAIATLRALHDLNYALVYTGPINDPIDYTGLFDYDDEPRPCASCAGQTRTLWSPDHDAWFCDPCRAREGVDGVCQHYPVSCRGCVACRTDDNHEPPCVCDCPETEVAP